MSKGDATSRDVTNNCPSSSRPQCPLPRCMPHRGLAGLAQDALDRYWTRSEP